MGTMNKELRREAAVIERKFENSIIIHMVTLTETSSRGDISLLSSHI